MFRENQFSNEILASQEIKKNECLEKMKVGRNFEVMADLGYFEFKKLLRERSYADIVDGQIKEIEDVIKYGQYDINEKNNNPQYQRAVQEQNAAMWERAQSMMDNLLKDKDFSPPSRASHSDFWASKRSNKFLIEGKDAALDHILTNFGEGFETRLYFNVETCHLPEAFLSLLNTFKEATNERGTSMLTYMNLVLNMEAAEFQHHKDYTHNGIFIRLNPFMQQGQMPLIASALSRFQNEHANNLSSPWYLSPYNTAKAKIGMVNDFRIPMTHSAPLINLVEMEEALAYDAEILPNRIRPAVGMHTGTHGEDLSSFEGVDFSAELQQLHRMQEQFKEWSPENPGIIDLEQKAGYPTFRQRNMPALIERQVL
jgi:hypothetical protein